MHDIACKIICPYTVYSIIRENYEHKDFVQSLWEMWKFIGIFVDEQKKKGKHNEYPPDLTAEAKLSCQIDEIFDGIFQNYQDYIDGLCEGVKERYGEHTDEFDECLRCIEELKKIRVIDERALEVLRRLEEAV